jgi:hypothetical protein
VFQSIPGVGEEGVDSALVAEIQRQILRFQTQRHTLVLLTGDGNDNEGAACLREAAFSAIANTNWKVEVWCWRLGCSRHYRELETLYADSGRFTLKFLDQFRDRVTYNQGDVLQVPLLVRIVSQGSQPGEPDAEVQEMEIDEDLMNCPILLEPLRDPVRTPFTKHYYERAAIEDHIASAGNCPLTRQQLTRDMLLNPTGEYLAQLAHYWGQYLSTLPEAEQADYERTLPPFVRLYRHSGAAASPPRRQSPPLHDVRAPQHGNEARPRGQLAPRPATAANPRGPMMRGHAQLCPYFLEGRCTYGSHCRMSHAAAPRPAEATRPVPTAVRPPPPTTATLPKNYRTQLCHHWEQSGTCPRDASCHFAHGVHQLRL